MHNQRIDVIFFSWIGQRRHETAERENLLETEDTKNKALKRIHQAALNPRANRIIVESGFKWQVTIRVNHAARNLARILISTTYKFETVKSFKIFRHWKKDGELRWEHKTSQMRSNGYTKHKQIRQKSRKRKITGISRSHFQ